MSIHFCLQHNERDAAWQLRFVKHHEDQDDDDEEYHYCFYYYYNFVRIFMPLSVYVPMAKKKKLS